MSEASAGHRARARSRGFAVLAVGAALIVAVLLLRCAETPDEHAGADAKTTGSETPSEPVLEAKTSTPAAATASAVEPSTSTATPTATSQPAPAPAPPSNTVARVMRVTDEHDRTLLAAIEKQSHTAPSQAIHDLLALRRSGATDQQLEAFMAEKLAGDLIAQLEAKRWLRAMREPGVGSAPPAVPKDTPLRTGGGVRRVQRPERVVR